jgi:hypothetical protein
MVCQLPGQILMPVSEFNFHILADVDTGLCCQIILPMSIPLVDAVANYRCRYRLMGLLLLPDYSANVYNGC